MSRNVLATASAALPAIFGPKATFSFTVFQGNSEYCWNTMPRSGPGPVMSSPSTRTSPLCGVT